MKISINNRHLDLAEIVMIGPLESTNDGGMAFEVLWNKTEAVCSIPVADEKSYADFVDHWLGREKMD